MGDEVGMTFDSGLQNALYKILKMAPFRLDLTAATTAQILARLVAESHQLQDRAGFSRNVVKDIKGLQLSRNGASQMAVYRATLQSWFVGPDQWSESEMRWVLWRVENLGAVAVFLRSQDSLADPYNSIRQDASTSAQGAQSSGQAHPAMRAAEECDLHQFTSKIKLDGSSLLYLTGHSVGGGHAQLVFIRMLREERDPELLAALLAGGLYTFGAPLVATQPGGQEPHSLLDHLIGQALKRCEGRGPAPLAHVHQFVNGLDLLPRVRGAVASDTKDALLLLTRSQPPLRSWLASKQRGELEEFQPLGTYHLMLKDKVRSVNSGSHPELWRKLLAEPISYLSRGLRDGYVAAQAAAQASLDCTMDAYLLALANSADRPIIPVPFLGGSAGDYEVQYGLPYGSTAVQPVAMLCHKPTGIVSYNAFVESSASSSAASSSSTNQAVQPYGRFRRLLGDVGKGVLSESGQALGQYAVNQIAEAVMGEPSAAPSTAQLGLSVAGRVASSVAGHAVQGVTSVVPFLGVAVGLLNMGASVYTAFKTRAVHKEVKKVHQDVVDIHRQGQLLVDAMNNNNRGVAQLGNMMHVGLVHLDRRCSRMEGMLDAGLLSMHQHMHGIQDEVQQLGFQVGAEFKQVRSLMGAGFTSVHQRMQGMEAGLGRVGMQVEAGFNEVQATMGLAMTSMNRRMDGVMGGVGHVSGQVEEGFQHMDNSLSRVSLQVVTGFNEIENMMGLALTSVNQRLDGVMGGVGHVSEQVQEGFLHMDNTLNALAKGLNRVLDDHTRLLEGVLRGVLEQQQGGFAMLQQQLAGMGRALQDLPNAVALRNIQNNLMCDWRKMKELYEIVVDMKGDDMAGKHDFLMNQAVCVRGTVDHLLTLMREGRTQEDPAALAGRVHLVELKAIASAILDFALSINPNKDEESRKYRQEACMMIDSELRKWLQCCTLYDMATVWRDLVTRYVFLRRSMQSPSQITAVMASATPGSAPQPTVAYDMHDLIWDDGLQDVRQLLCRDRPARAEERIPDIIPINSAALVVAYQAWKELPAGYEWREIPTVPTAELLHEMGVPPEKQPDVQATLHKSDALQLLLSASRQFRAKVVLTMESQLPGSSLREVLLSGCALPPPSSVPPPPPPPPSSSSTGGPPAGTPPPLPAPTARTPVKAPHELSLETPPTLLQNVAVAPDRQPNLEMTTVWEAVKDLVCVIWSPDGKLLATASKGPPAAVTVWQLPAAAAGHVVKTAPPVLMTLPSQVTAGCLSWQPKAGASFLALGSCIGKGSRKEPLVKLWAVQSWPNPSYQLRVKDRQVSSLAWSPSGQLLAALCETGALLVWDHLKLDETRLDKKWPEFDRGFSAAWSSDEQWLAWAGLNGEVFWYDFKGDILKTRKEHTDKVTALAWAPAGYGKNEVLVTAGMDNVLCVWAAAEPSTCLVQQNAKLTSLAWRQDGKVLASASLDGRILLWDTTSWSVIAEYALERNHRWVISMEWSPSGDVLAVGTKSGHLALWNCL